MRNEQADWIILMGGEISDIFGDVSGYNGLKLLPVLKLFEY